MERTLDNDHKTPQKAPEPALTDNFRPMKQVGDVQLHIADLVDLDPHLQQPPWSTDARHRRRLAVVVQRQIPHTPRMARQAENLRLEVVAAVERFLREELRVHDAVVLRLGPVLGHLRLHPAVLGHVGQQQPVAAEPAEIAPPLLDEFGPVRIERGHVKLGQTLKRGREPQPRVTKQNRMKKIVVKRCAAASYLS